jgi:nicotinate-nucleotide pyrophosphorylase
MLVGGVDTHRVDLSSMIMLKDNHVWSTGTPVPRAQSEIETQRDIGASESGRKRVCFCLCQCVAFSV